jgi:hypothetical protein
MRRTALLTALTPAVIPPPAYVSSNAAGVATGVAPITVTTPAGSTGDRLIVFMGSNNAGSTWTETTTSDFTSTGTPASGMATFTRITTGSEAGTYTFTRATNTTAAAFVVMVRLSNAGTVQAVAFTSTTGTSIALAQVTAAANNFLLQFVVKASTGASTWTAPGTATRRTTAGATSADTALPYAIGDEFVGAGATGTRTWNQSAGSSPERGVLIAVNPL